MQDVSKTGLTNARLETARHLTAFVSIYRLIVIFCIPNKRFYMLREDGKKITAADPPLNEAME